NKLDLCLEILEGEIQIHVGEFARRRVFVHAGVVAWNNRVLVLPGRSMSGKSTLVAALLRAGATYYSDEYAVLDEDGLVYPYPRRLALRQQHAHALRPTAESLGSREGTQPLRGTLVAFVEHVPGGSWSPRLMLRGAAVIELLSHALPVQRRPDFALVALNRFAANARFLRSTRGEAMQAA